MRLHGTVALAALWLAGCSSVWERAGTPREAVVGADQAASAASAQTSRTNLLGLASGQCDQPRWAMTGRVALSNGRDGGSGRIEWAQGERRSEVMLSAPVTRQSWTLVVDAAGARLDGVPNGPLVGADAAQLLRDATGWEIPVSALGCWLRGVPAAAAVYGESTLTFGSDLLPLRIEQGGWAVDYSDWKADAASGVMLPSRVNAQRGEDRVRLVVDRWGSE